MSDHHNVGKDGWREVTRRAPCPICKKSSWCSVSEDGDVCLCRRESAGSESTKTDQNGGIYYVHRLRSRQTCSGDWPTPRHSPADGKGERAKPKILDRVYRAFLAASCLRSEHERLLRNRGLCALEIDKRGYRCLDMHRKVVIAKVLRDQPELEKYLSNVPGFYVADKNGRRDWSLTGLGGMVFPVRNAHRQIVALKVRLDNPGDGGKYRWVSSRSKDGPGPGAPIHVPAFDGDTTTIRVTEGPLKGDVATSLSGILTVAIPGVAIWKKHLVTILVALGARVVLVAFDADARTNRTVAEQLRLIVAHLRGSGFEIRLEVWDEREGKGIDDLLAAGKKPEVVTGDDVVAKVEEILTAAELADPPLPPPTLDVDGVNYAEDDPNRLAKLYLNSRIDNGWNTFYYWRDEFGFWDGTSYGVRTDKALRAELVNVVQAECDRLNREAIKLRKQKRPGGALPKARRVDTKLVSNVVQALTGLALLDSKTEPPCWLDGDETFPPRSCIATRNGVVSLPHLVAGEPHFVPPTPKFFTRNGLDFDFDVDAPNPKHWLEFLKNLWPNDVESVKALQELFGYALTSDTSQQKIFMIVGPKRSGKGTIARVLQRLIGRENVGAPTLGSMGSTFGL